MKKKNEDILASYVDALRPIIYINHFDSVAVDKSIQRIGQTAKILEFNNAFGVVDFESKSPMFECGLEEFLKMSWEDGYEQQTFIVLKDVHEELPSPKVTAILKRIAENTLNRENYFCTVFIVAPKTIIPVELENYITIFDIPLPSNDEIMEIIQEFIRTMDISVEEASAWQSPADPVPF